MPSVIKPARSGPPLESEILRDCRMWLASQPDIVIHRNNTGKLRDANGRLVTVGLAEGSSDLIGSLTVWSLPLTVVHHPDGRVDYVASKDRQSIARSLCIELKQPGKKPTDDQVRFLESHAKAGWIAFWADNLGEVQRMIERARRWEI
jgi:hypothetical protein